MRFMAGVMVAAGIMTAPASAQDFIEFHTENVQLLRGFDYELGDRERTIITLEHANRWRYGDLFVFADFTIGDDGQRSAYGEISPRLSLSRMTGQDWSFGLVRDVYLAGNVELGDEGLDRLLYGAAVDLDLPGFTFFKLHAYHRDDPQRPGSTWQVNFAWNRPFQIGDQRFLTEGFADLAGAEGFGTEHQLVVPRLLWQVPAWEHVWVGVEYQYWHNKFGVPGVTESVSQLQVKFVLP
ncbi:outer membrane protein OmpK [Maricaulis parjimensis]|uniref:outer membrane protein OmpK n=1 Tax=Maricaulis parjimensis TaxID=144023 RepID=UPI001939B380|nr:outer membrane protein OmpK [Maricaulis parjimensis]